MLRSTQSILKQAARLSRPTISSSAPRVPLQVQVVTRASSTAPSSSAFFEYDQIMHTSASNFSSSAESTPASTYLSAPGGAKAMAQVPSGMGAAQVATESNCYKSLDE
eukprot:49991_1